jgi:hypothetical protein
MATIDIEQTRNQARALFDSRIESVTALVKTRQRTTDLKEQLTEAEREDKRAYVRATRDGWSAEELKKLGLESGAATRRRKTTNRTAPPTMQHRPPRTRAPASNRCCPSPTRARQKLFPSGFSRTHVDDRTPLTGCTPPPGRHGRAADHRDRRSCTASNASVQHDLTRCPGPRQPAPSHPETGPDFFSSGRQRTGINRPCLAPVVEPALAGPGR